MPHLQNLIALLLLAALTTGCGSSDPPSKPDPGTASTTAPEKPPAVTGIPAEHLDRIVERFNRGVGLMDQYRAADAAEAFTEVVQLAPGWPSGRLNLGIALLNAQGDERFRRAEKELEIVIAQQPDNCRAHYALGMLLRHLTRFDEARDHFEHVLRVDPDDADAHYQFGILVMDEDPAAAREHLEKTLERLPHHQSACYRLQALLRKLGEHERARKMLARFQQLKGSGSGVTAGMKYGEMGRYAEVVRVLNLETVHEGTGAPVAFVDVAEEVGLTEAAGGRPGWPSMGSLDYGPGVAVADVDNDDDLDIYVPNTGPDARGRLYLNEKGKFTPAADSKVDGRGAVGAFFGDYDADGAVDLYLTCHGPNRLYRNDGQGRFNDVTESTGTAGGDCVSLGAAWADADHDGDLDLYVANLTSTAGLVRGNAGAANNLWRNNRDGSFTDVAVEAGIDGGDARTTSVVFLDVDDDHDLDLYLINNAARNQLYLNDRVGRYRNVTLDNSIASPDDPCGELTADDDFGWGAVLGDVDRDGREDLFLLRGSMPPRLFMAAGRHGFREDPLMQEVLMGIEGVMGGHFADVDLDGDLDLVLLGARINDAAGHYLMTNVGAGPSRPASETADTRLANLLGRFDPPVRFADQPAVPAVRGSVVADLDGDGALELLVARAGARPELWRLAERPDHRWLEVNPVKVAQEPSSRPFPEPMAIGMQIEVKTGPTCQVAGIRSSSGYLGCPPPRAHFGLGEFGKCDYVRLTWPDAVFQSELDVAADQRWPIAKVTRKPSSCPVLFSWDGERFAYVTDILGVGGLGFFVSPGQYAPPDPTEDVRIPPRLFEPRDGRYLLRIAEPLEEVVYLDQLHLIAYDHPATLEVYPNERFAYGLPAPDGRPLAVAKRVFPAAARDEEGRDVLDEIAQIDRRYVEPPADPRFVGFAEDHWIELEFGDELRRFGPDDEIFLFLYGWTEYTYSHVNYAAHQAGVTMRSPAIEIPGARSEWQVAVADAGFPAGLPRMMTIDVSSLPIRQHGRLRLRTNMMVFWDQIFLAKDAVNDQVTSTVIRPEVARLCPLGYPREFSPDGSEPPHYDYHRREHGVPFKNLTGNFTRFGDVRTLLKEVDDRFVIMGRGEEIALEFNAARLPVLPEDRSRTFVVHVDGYCKDMDLYTAAGDGVAPLPYHGMTNYPPVGPPAQRHPSKDELERLNTRRVLAH